MIHLNLLKPKKAQVTIFIIIGIIIVVLIALFFLFRNEVITIVNLSQEINPRANLEGCMEDKVREAVDLISSQGGYVEPELYKTFQFSGEAEKINLAYFCFNMNYYSGCINQEPMLIPHLKNEIKNYVGETVKECFNELEESLEKRGYTVNVDYRDFEVDLMPKKIIVRTDSEITFEKSGQVSSEKNLIISYASRFYDLAVVGQEIFSQEARFCNFEHLGYMLLYPEYEIDKFRTGDSTTIYTITHRNSKEKFRFAIRSCAMPPGI